MYCARVRVPPTSSPDVLVHRRGPSPSRRASITVLAAPRDGRTSVCTVLLLSPQRRRSSRGRVAAAVDWGRVALDAVHGVVVAAYVATRLSPSTTMLSLARADNPRDREAHLRPRARHRREDLAPLRDRSRSPWRLLSHQALRSSPSAIAVASSERHLLFSARSENPDGLTCDVTVCPRGHRPRAESPTAPRALAPTSSTSTIRRRSRQVDSVPAALRSSSSRVGRRDGSAEVGSGLWLAGEVQSELAWDTLPDVLLPAALRSAVRAGVLNLAADLIARATTSRRRDARASVRSLRRRLATCPVVASRPEPDDLPPAVAGFRAVMNRLNLATLLPFSGGAAGDGGMRII